MTEEKKPEVSQYNIEGKALEAFLGPLEANVMDAIWSSKKTPVSVREIHEKLKQTKTLAYTTIMSTMDRLFEKNLLDRKIEKGRGGLYYVYWPALERQPFQKSAVREVLSSLINNFGDVVTNCLVDETCLSEEERKVIKEQLNKNIIKKKE
ncbi:MAG: BlaI/MecI/CopY family transcriptional regulator [Candidatus Bathyarchaeota archaeon]|nr:BlaI/MecI/CopY family transcriptional regulator [Candidatus Termiticorpusculum sp.]